MAHRNFSGRVVELDWKGSAIDGAAPSGLSITLAYMSIKDPLNFSLLATQDMKGRAQSKVWGRQIVSSKALVVNTSKKTF